MLALQKVLLDLSLFSSEFNTLPDEEKPRRNKTLINYREVEIDTAQSISAPTSPATVNGRLTLRHQIIEGYKPRTSILITEWKFGKNPDTLHRLEELKPENLYQLTKNLTEDFNWSISNGKLTTKK